MSPVGGRSRHPRFMIKVYERAGGWEVEIYDLDDHGHTTPYATAYGSNIDAVMHTASHYVLVAS